MRLLYTALFYLILPLLFVRLWWKSRKQSLYRTRWSERLGKIPDLQTKDPIWVHAVSLGEVIAAKPLVRALEEQYPDKKIIITTMTATGSREAKKMISEQVCHFFVPYDVPLAINRFMEHIHPSCLIIMETELWPNLIHCVRLKNIPILLANARLSDKSFKSYRRFKFLSSLLFKPLTHVMAQSEQDASRFNQLGIEQKNITSAGNLKFDLSVPEQQVIEGKAFKEKFFPNRPVWIAASTHAGEEELILSAHEEILKTLPSALLILVPRHPERFDDVAKLCNKHQMSSIRRSHLSNNAETHVAVLLGDSMGELYFYYAMSDIAFVGGSLVPIGGHNLLEPAALHLPIITGKNLSNFRAISSTLKNKNALIKVNDTQELFSEVTKLLQNPTLKKQMGEAAYSVIAQNRGALNLHLDHLKKLIT